MGCSGEIIEFSNELFCYWVDSSNQELIKAGHNVNNVISCKELCREVNKCESAISIAKLADKIGYKYYEDIEDMYETTIEGKIYDIHEGYGLADMLMRYWRLNKGTKIKINSKNKRDSSWRLDSDVFDRIGESDIESYIIDVDGIDKNRIASNIAKMRLLGHGMDIIPGKYAIQVYKQNEIVKCSSERECQLWKFAVIAERPDGYYKIYEIDIIPDMFPQLYGYGITLNYEGYNVNKFITIPWYKYVNLPDDGDCINDEVILWIYDGNGKYHLSKGNKLDEDFRAEYMGEYDIIENSKETIQDRGKSLIACAVDINMWELIEMCFYEIDNYVSSTH